jgi:TRAP-type mannitol/chloroaromatic compound transport system permease small subunit
MRRVPSSLQALVRGLEAVSDGSGRLVSWLTLLMVLVTCAVVVLRYAFDLGWIAMQESVTYLHASVFLIGAAYTLRHEGHVRVDIFYRKLSRRLRAWVDLLGALLLLMPVCGFMVWISWDYVVQSWALGEGSREAGGLPFVYLLKTLILAMGVLLLLQGLASLARNLLYLSGHPLADAPEGNRDQA